MLIAATVLSLFLCTAAEDQLDELDFTLEDDPGVLCLNSSCYPRWGNLLKGRRVTANSTCGKNGPEEYCLVSNERKDITCDTCDASNIYKHHPPNYMKDRRIKSRTTWWKAENGVDEVTLQLDLETTFQFTHLIMVFYSFRPGAMVIERSMDYGNTWLPYQYFAYDCHRIFGMRERELGEPDEYGIQRHPDEDVICTSKYSYLEPAQGGEVIYKVIRGRPTNNANRPSLRNLLLLTNLRVRFVKLHTLGDEILDPNDTEAKKKYFYAVEDWVVRGSCFCNGHADLCTPMTGMNSAASTTIKNMINGQCVCRHNTAGYNCQQCKDFHHSLPWLPGDPTTGEPHACKECSCNDHSQSCEFDDQLYSKTGDGGRCTDCQHSTAGPHCDMCVYGYYQIDGRQLNDTDICQPCNCNEAGTASQICASVTNDNVTAGTCICKANVEATLKCDTCKPDHFNIAADNPLGCTACGCDTRGTVEGTRSCDLETGQCQCKDDVEGQACDRCKVGFFNIMSGSERGCEQCSCDSVGSISTEKCDPLTGACACRTGFTGYHCSEIIPGYFIPSLDHWNYNPEHSATIHGEGYSEKATNSSGTGYVVLPVNSSIEQSTDQREGEEEEPGMLEMRLPTGFHDLKIYHEAAESDYTLTLELDHTGKYDGTEPTGYACGFGNDEAQTEQPFSKQTISIVVKAGSTVTRLEDLCMDEGSQYSIKLDLAEEGTGALVIQDLVIVEPVEPEKAFPENPAKEELYREYQELGCPMGDGDVRDIDNECFRLKGELEQGLDSASVSEPCGVTICLPDLDVWEFEQDKDKIELDRGAQVIVKEGGNVRLPPDGSMTVPLDPGTGGYKEVILSHDPALKNNEIVAQVTVSHIGNKDGSSPSSYRCNGELIRPYNETTFSVKIKKNKHLTTIGDICLDPNGNYLVTISPASTGPDLTVKEVFVTYPDQGDVAFPASPELAELWEQYMGEQCPKVAGGLNHDKPECIALINQINEIVSNGDKEKDCSKNSCIPYNPIWEPEDAIDNLAGGSYVDPENGQIVLPNSDSMIELPVEGRTDSITGSLTDILIKHDPLAEAQEVLVQLVRTDSDEAYSCGILQSVPQTQLISVTLGPGTNYTVVSTFCIVEDGEYEIKISGVDIDDAVKINEIGSALPSDSGAAFPDNEAAADYYEQYLDAGCDMHPVSSASQECLHLANLVDYHTDPARQGTHDCSVEFCYPTADVFNPVSPKSGTTVADGATYDKADGSIILPSGGKVVLPLEPIITGPNTVVVEYESNNPPAQILVLITYRGTADGTHIGEYKCRDETVKPGNSVHTLLIDTSLTRALFEVCLVQNGLYNVQIVVTEPGKSINVNKIYVELPRNTTSLFGDQTDGNTVVDGGAELLDFLVSNCENAVFSSACAAASQGVQQLVEEINDLYKVDCSKQLCLPEENVWSKGDTFEGNTDGSTDSGSVILSGDKWVILQFDGAIAPKEGLNSLIFTVNPADYNRVVDILIAPTPGSVDENTEYQTCGDVSSSKPQNIRKVIQASVAFVEVGPVCIDPDLQYDVQMSYKGVRPPNSDRIYSDTSGINVIIESVDIALPMNPTDAFSDNEEAASIWEDYVGSQCPRLSAGYREAEQACLDLLDQLQNLLNDVAEEECEVTVCIDTTAGWRHDPLSDKEIYENGTVVSGGSKDAVIQIPPGGEIRIQTGEKELSLPDENIPRTGTMDLLVDHKKSRYTWSMLVEVTHTKTKGDAIPTTITCGNKTVDPFTTQEYRTEATACTSKTSVPGVCVDKDSTYTLKITVLERLGDPVQCEGAVQVDTGLPVDQVILAFPEDPETAFPDRSDLQDTYLEYVENNCGEVRSAACDRLDIDIIASLVGEAAGCNCDMRGSLSKNCDSVGGQCLCKDGYTGRRCSLCTPGFFGLDRDDMCSPCNCNAYGSKSQICDENGQCPCYDGVLTSAERAGLTDCSQCIDGFVGLDNLGIEGCERCECGAGAALSNCDESTGTCSCLQGVAQPRCNNCSTGFYNLLPNMGCEACQCNAAGSDGIGCDQNTGVCSCKENVVGTKCDSCKPNAFAMSTDNPAGCLSCYCSGATDQCTGANDWTVVPQTLNLDWTAVGGAVEVRSKYVIGAVKGAEFVWSAENIGDFYTSYSLDLTVQLTGYDQNEVLLRLYRGTVYITAVLVEIREKLLSVALFEHNFVGKKGPVSHQTFRHVLDSITKVEITTVFPVFPEARRHDQKMKGFTIERAEESVSTSEGTRPATSVELCLCPAGYTGHACGTCIAGYAKRYNSNGVMQSCVECSELCNGYSSSCDRETGECYNCSGNTVGTQCHACQEGFYPNSTLEDGGLVCHSCPCSRNTANPSCSIGDGANGPVCDDCVSGYTGPNCLDCAPGYFGSEGQCTACECNNNIDLSNPYSCDKDDGVCRNCIYNTTGVECQSCKHGYYGNALKTELPKCLECRCSDIGSLSQICDNFSGLCDCLAHVSGNRCDRCSPGYWNMTSETGCTPCECDAKGAVSAECEMDSGMCECKEGIQGRQCDECLAGRYNTNSDNSLEFECTVCDCDLQGSTSTQCDSTGQCSCKEGVVGVQCRDCARGTTGTFPDCVPCGECYNKWEEEVAAIEREINQLAALAQNIHLGAANLTEEELQEMFKEMRQTLREAEKLAKSSPGSNEDIINMTNTLTQLREALESKSTELGELDGRIDDIDQSTAETLDSLDLLQEKLEDFRVATNRLAEKAMNLSAANLDEALKLVEDASERSEQAKQAAAATKAQVENAESMARRAERILGDDVFSDTTTLETLADIETQLGDLTTKLGELDQHVCGADLDTCDTCGGSQCDFCGGPGCGGAVGIIAGITQLADDARDCADERQKEVTVATADLRGYTSQADEIQETVDQIKRDSEATKQDVIETESDLQEVKRNINQLLQGDRATAAEIEQIITDINSLSLPLTEDELSQLIDALIAALNDINLVNTNVEVSAPDRERVATLLERAKAASGNANSTLEAILNATTALREFDDNYRSAQEMLAETSEIVNEGWNAITEIELNTAAAEQSRDGLDADLDALEQELQLLIADISSGDGVAQMAQDEIDQATQTVQSNEDQVSRLKKDYDALDDLITEKEALVDQQLADSRDGSELSQQVVDRIDDKIVKVEELTEKYVTQQQTLIDLNSELDTLETELDSIMERIHVKATYHAQCKNDIAS